MNPPTATTVLFLCTGNSCRSQMAEGFGKASAPMGMEVLSAGTDPEGIHPRAVEVMDEVGIDIQSQRPQDLAGIDLATLDHVVTLCGSADERCPALPGGVAKEHWPLPDPAAAAGSDEAVMAVFRSVRDEIRQRVEELIARLAGSS